MGVSSLSLPLLSLYSPSTLSLLARPRADVCANGQGIMYDNLKKNIQQGEKLVMLHNTGGVVQAFCSLYANESSHS